MYCIMYYDIINENDIGAMCVELHLFYFEVHIVEFLQILHIDLRAINVVNMVQ